MGSMTAIVLSSPRVVRELLDIRSASTSDRPSNHFVDITTDGNNLGLAHYGTEWKLLRRTVRDILTREACQKHLPIQQAEATQLMYDLLKDPQVTCTFPPYCKKYRLICLTLGVLHTHVSVSCLCHPLCGIRLALSPI